MTDKLTYLGNSIKLSTAYATLQCKDDDNDDNIAFIKQGFLAKIHLVDITKTVFWITNKTKYSIIAGLHDHRLSVVSHNICTIAEKHIIKPFETLKFKVPTMINDSKIRFYTIASQVKNVTTDTHNSSSLSSSSDEYLPNYINEGLNNYTNNLTQTRSTEKTELSNFETVIVEQNNSSQTELYNIVIN